MFINIAKSTISIFRLTLALTAISLCPAQSMQQEDGSLEVSQPCDTSALSSVTTNTTQTTLDDTKPQSSLPQYNQNTSQYIIPQLRRPLDNKNTSKHVKSQSSLPRHNQSTLKSTSHAEVRKRQRGISNKDIQTAMQNGKKEEYKRAITYTNEETKVVAGKNGKIITTITNKRNSNFDLLQISKNKEKFLLNKVTYKNNDHAMCELAELYLSGELGNREIKKAYDLLLRAASRGNSHAMCLLSNLYENGDLGEVDREASLKWLEKAANRNNLGALAKVGQYYLAAYLKNSNLQSIDEQQQRNLIQKAKCYLERAAAKGQTRAIWTLAQIQEKGYLGETNLPRAIELYIKAAKLGSPNSLNNLNQLVLEGKIRSEHFEEILDEVSVPLTKTSRGLAVQIGLRQIDGQLGKNPKRGFEMVKRVAEAKGGNNAIAIRELAKCYRDGKGCDPDLSLAQYWFQQLEALYKKAASQGNIQAMFDLGLLYLKDSLGNIFLEKAEQIFMQAANTGDVARIFCLGQLYITGELGDKEPSAGIEWVNKANKLWIERAECGDVEAMESLIDLYLDKDGLGFKDYDAAAKWLSTRLKHGYFPSLNSNILRLAGWYNKKNQYAEAEYWYSILANKQHPRALESLARMHQKRQLAIDSNTAVTNPWVLQLRDTLHEHAEKSPIAALHLARLYETGDLLLKKIGEAVKWLFLASSSKDSNYYDIIDLSIFRLNNILNFKNFTIEEQQEIIQGILHYKDIEEKPYRVGRILGDIYSQGILIEPNYQEALFWYEKAAKFGNSTAMYHIGALYETGVFEGTNLSKAVEWYDLSAAQGNERAVECLVKLHNSVTLDNSSKMITEKWIKLTPSFNDDENKTTLSSRSKDPEDMYRLAEKIRNSGQEKEKDALLAAYWYRRAGQKGHSESAFALGNMYVSGELGNKVRPVGIHWHKEAAKSNHRPAMKTLQDIYTNGDIVAPSLNKANKWKKREDELFK